MCQGSTYHVYSAVSAAKSDLTSFRLPPISTNFFFVENLCTFRRPQVSLLNPLILLYDSHILPWIIYDWEASAVSAPLNYRWIFLRPRGLKLRNKHGKLYLSDDSSLLSPSAVSQNKAEEQLIAISLWPWAQNTLYLQNPNFTICAQGHTENPEFAPLLCCTETAFCLKAETTVPW